MTTLGRMEFPVHRPKHGGRARSIGVALGAGGARGLAHIGVLRGLAEEGVSVDAIVGTSSGALVGAIYAAGQLENFERQMREFQWSDVLGLFDPVWPRSGLMSGSRVVERLTSTLGDWKIEDLSIPFAAVAVDLVTGDEVLIRHGRVLDAVRASISIPGIFRPYVSGARVLVDGALRNPVPVSALSVLGADVRIAVNLHRTPVREIADRSRWGGRRSVTARMSDALEQQLSRFRKRPRVPEPPELESDGLPNLLEVLTASMSVVEYELAQHRLAREHVDVRIEPDVHGIRAFDFHKAAPAIEAGLIATRGAGAAVRRAQRLPQWLRRRTNGRVGPA